MKTHIKEGVAALLIGGFVILIAIVYSYNKTIIDASCIDNKYYLTAQRKGVTIAIAKLYEMKSNNQMTCDKYRINDQ